jgi:hypothetical protein
MKERVVNESAYRESEQVKADGKIVYEHGP